MQVGTSLIKPVVLTNTGKASTTISNVTTSGTGFSFAGPNLPVTVAPRQSVTISVSFAPQTAASFTGSATASAYVTWGGRNKTRYGSVSVSLSGTGYSTSPGYLTVPPSLNLGTVLVGGSQTQPLTLSNTGGSSVTISGATLTGTGFSVSGMNFPYNLPAGASANLSVTFAPTASGTDNASLSFSSNAPDSAVGVSLTGSGTTSGYLSAPPSLNLGSVTLGSSQTQLLTVSNTGGSSLTISGASLNGTGYSVSGLSFPYNLAAGASANLSVVFAPTTAGTDNATLTLASNASDASVAVSLMGSGTSSSGTLGVTPGSMSFGSVTIGSTQVQNGSVTASGGSVTLSSTSSSNSAFSLSGLSLPLTLAAGQSVPFTVTFAPTASGTASANISFFASNSNSASETASGSGATVQHTVDLSWNASTSTSVTGYNVYRGASASGPYSRINSALNPSMNYSDGTVQSGNTYYYVTTAVDSSGTESSYSNQVTAAVPFP